MKKRLLALTLSCLATIALFAGCQSTPAESEVVIESQPEEVAPIDTDSSVAEVGETLGNLLYAVEGESNAGASYLAFAEVADDEGYPEIARVFRATADAELKHADDEWELASTLGATTRPTAGEIVPGTTAENLQTAIDGETAEYTGMYPGFVETATLEGNAEAIRIFLMAQQAEEVHAGVYTALLEALDNLDPDEYVEIYRCPVCGLIEIGTLDGACPICGVAADSFIAY